MSKRDGCIDTNEDAKDHLRSGCPHYKNVIDIDTNRNNSYCGRRDDEDFKSNEMCCACGGGRYGISLNYCSNSNKAYKDQVLLKATHFTIYLTTFL